MTPSEELTSRREALSEAILRAVPRDRGIAEEDLRQFVAGYLNLMSASASGDDTPRDDYLATVIPAIKQAGMPLAFVVRSLVLVDVHLVPLISGENRPWVSSFCVDYSERMIQTWERS